MSKVSPALSLSLSISATLQSPIQIHTKKRRKNECEQQCEVWTPALEPQPSRIPHIPARAGAGAGNRSEQACWAQRIVACLPFLSFRLWNKTAFFLVGHLPENSLRY